MPTTSAASCARAWCPRRGRPAVRGLRGRLQQIFKLEIIKVSQPPPLFRTFEEASGLAFAAADDKQALEIIQEAIGPDYKVVGVSSRESVLNAGIIHCITQQHPAAR